MTRLLRLLALFADAILGDPPIRWRDDPSLSPFGPVATGVVRRTDGLAGRGSPHRPARFPRSTAP